MNYAEVVAKDLLAIQAVTLSPDHPYTWASGLHSPIYTDNRLTISYPAVRRSIYQGMTELIKEHFPTVEVVAGTATAGIPHAAWVAEEMQLPLVYVRSKPKDHGQGKQIEGVIRPGQAVVVIDDLISTGGSVLNAVAAVNKAGAKVIGVIAVFTYQLPAADQNFAAQDLEYYAVTNYPTLVKVAKEQGLISTAHLASLNDWRQDPAAWSDQHADKE